MKVLLINGSPRKNGNTFLALSEAAKTLEQQGIETDMPVVTIQSARNGNPCISSDNKNKQKYDR